MRRSAPCLFPLLLAGLLAAAPLFAQGISASDTAASRAASYDGRAVAEPAARPRPRHRPDFIGARVATARRSAFPTRLGRPAYRDFYAIDLRAGWTIATGEDAVLEYMPSITPLAISTRNPDYVRAPQDCTEGCTLPAERGTVPVYHTAYGFGLAPLGFQLRLFPRAAVRPFAHVIGGALWFTRRIPDPMATRFNFTAEAGGGLEIALPKRHALAIGYAFHHTSNGGTGKVNPGVNSGVLTVGITVGARN